MGKGRQVIVLFNRLFHILTDWLLIILGLALGVVAWRAIDVASVKYVVIVIGCFLVAVGFWSRHRRVVREKAGLARK